MRRFRTITRALFAIWTIACTDAATSKAGTAAAGNFVEPAAVSPPPDATAAQLVAFQAKRFATGFVPEGDAVLGELPALGRSDHMLVLRAGRCYRIVGAGGETAIDLDLFLFDPNGVQTHQDPGQDRFPVLGIQAEICPVQTGSYRVQVRMYEGSGAFAFGLYRTP